MNVRPTIAILAATVAAGGTGAAIASAAGNGTSTTPSAASSAQRQRPNETALTGETKQKVEAAALAKVPGTVIRTETDEGGVYESHIRKSDGTEVEVKVDKTFTVTAVDTMDDRGDRGDHHGGRGPHADLTAVAKALGVTEAKLQAAVDAARPDRSANPDKRGDDAAAIASALGQSTADVQAVLDAAHADGPHGHGPGDDSALVSALAKKFAVSTDKAQAAVDAAEKAEQADHQARETAMYAAVAKALGKDAAAVQKAFEANRPAKGFH